jgi:hypothetical protein
MAVTTTVVLPVCVTTLLIITLQAMKSQGHGVTVLQFKKDSAAVRIK